jgi:hypothetical protein
MVTALAVALSLPARRPGVRRTAELRFGHPFAVIAVATARIRPAVALRSAYDRVTVTGIRQTMGRYCS